MKYKIIIYHDNELIQIEKIKKFPKKCEEIPYFDSNADMSEEYFYIEAISKLNALYIATQIYRELGEEYGVFDFLETQKEEQFKDNFGKDNMLCDIHKLTKEKIKISGKEGK